MPQDKASPSRTRTRRPPGKPATHVVHAGGLDTPLCAAHYAEWRDGPREGPARVDAVDGGEEGGWTCAACAEGAAPA